MKQTIRGFRFGPFQLDLARYALTRNGLTVRISGSQMELLALFVSRPGELITREQIVSALWKEPQSVDIRQGVNTAVTRLRGVLRDDPAAPRYIETVIGKGYRFVAGVDELETEEPRQRGPDLDIARLVVGPVYLDSLESTSAQTAWKSSTENGTVPQAHFADVELSAPPPDATLEEFKSIPAGGLSRRWLVVGGVCVVIFGCLLAVVKSRMAGDTPHEAPVGAAIHSVAVIPLVNLSDDKEQQYFADGLTDALISDLAASTRLRVTSRASSMHFQGLNFPSGEMAKQLGVEALVEGSVLRMGDRMRVTVHLVDARLDRDLWSQSFDTPFNSSLAVVGTIGQNVSRSLAQPVENVRQRQSPVAEVNPQAYDDYLRGRYLWRKRDMASIDKAIDYFKRAIREQPGFALAHSGLSDAYLVSPVIDLLPVDEARRLARQEAEEAIRLGPQLAEAHTSMAMVHAISLEWADAEWEFRLAIAIDPSYSTARQWYSNGLSLQGRHAEAIEQAQRGIEADPLSPMIQTQLGVAFYYARRYDEAIAAFKKTLEMEPHFFSALGRMSLSYAMKGMYTEALDTLRSTPETEKECVDYLAYVEGRAGHTASAASLIRRMEEVHADSFSMLYATLPLGDKTRSFELMRLVVANHQIDNLAVEPLFDPLRSDPRYQVIVKELHMP